MTMPTTSTESTTDSTTESDLPEVTPADLGYDEPAAAPVVPPVATPAKPAEVVKPVEAPVTGYGKEKPAEAPAAAPVVPPEAKPDDKPVELTEEQKAVKEIETVVSTLGDGYSKEKISKFALDNKLTKAQVEAYVAQVKSDDAAAVKANEQAVTERRKSWNDELVADKDFGGANFDTSIHEVESLVEKMFPNTKKVLTEKKGMLPPYFMKDLLAVAKALKPTNKFEGGEPPAPPAEGTSFLDDMYG